jgi:23S rRNA pseudouridine2605 synthase
LLLATGMERIQKILAAAGFGSRRACEEFISAGLVRVNGTVATLGDSADHVKDNITCNGKKVRKQKLVYFALNKPSGYIVTSSDDQGRATVLDLIKVPERIFPVGRLDKDTEGLLIMTNDGDLSQAILHPKHLTKKEYEVILDKPLDPTHKIRFQKGIPLDYRKVAMKISDGQKKLRVEIHEGRKHVLKRIFRRLGYEVKYLRRIRIGHLTLRGISKGSYKILKYDDIKKFLIDSKTPQVPASGKRKSK